MHGENPVTWGHDEQNCLKQQTVRFCAPRNKCMDSDPSKVKGALESKGQTGMKY